ncbi:MAG: hypothetical protein J1F42_01610 [Lachnospiraceae bacterium]|nr:hypothetical protein [Lachnospiraceae bacterium]
MAHYDGVIRIITDITTKDAKESLSSLEYQIKKSAKEINSLRSKMDALKDQKVPTKEFKDLQDKLSKAEKEMEKMLAQDSKFANLDAKIKKLSSSAADLAEKMKGAEVRIPTEEYKTLETAIDRNKTELESLIKAQKDLAREGIGKGADKQYLVAAEAVERLKNELQQAVSVGDKGAYLGIEDSLNRAKSVLQELMAKEPRPLGKIQYYYAIEHKIKDLKSSISNAEDEMRRLSEAGKDFNVNTDSPEYQKFASKYESVNQELEKTKSLHSEIAQKQAESVQKVAELKTQISQLVQEGKDFTLGKDTAEYANYARQIQYEENAIAAAGEHYKKLLGSQTESYKKLGETAKKALNSIGNWLKKLNSFVDSFTKRFKSVFSKIGKSANTASKGLSGVSLSLKNILKYGFGISGLYMLINKLRTAITEGFGNLLDYSKSLENSINGIKATALTLKNAFAAAFSPFVEVALPYVQKLLDYMVQLVNIAGQFFAAITGRKTYIRAIKQTTDALKEETKEMNKQLSPLDMLNNLTSQKSTSADAGTGGTMFEEVPIEDNILNVADRIKDILSKLLEPLKEAWDREGQFVMDSWKYALEEVWKLVKDIGRDFLTVWNEDETVAILANILHIIGDVGLVVGNLARNFREAWNENEVGLNILRNIRDIIGIIVQHIRSMADATVEWADKLNFYPILDAFERFLDSIKPVVDAIWGVLEDFYTKVLLPFSKWTIEKGLPELLQVFINFNNKVDWQSLRANLAEFWEHLEPFAETVGEGLILFIQRVSDALADFLNSQEFKDFLKTVEDWMDSVSPEDVANALEMIAKGLIALKLALLGFSAIKGIAGIFTAIKSFLAFFGVGGGATAAAGGAGMLATALHGLVYALAAVAAAVVGWKIGEWINEKLLGVDTPSFMEMMEGIKSSFTDGSWKDALKLWGDDIYNAFVTLGERQDEAIEGMKEKIKSFGEYIKEDWNNAYIGQMIASFKDGSWKEALNLWGEDIKAGIKSVGEFIKDDWNNAYIGQMIASFKDGSWKEALSLWGNDIRNAFVMLGDRLSETWNKICNNLKSTMKSALDWISQKASSISSSIGSFGNKVSGAFKNFSISSTGIQIPVSPVVAALSNVEIPAYATGQVIPRTMKQHLAILGDNTQETEVVSPLSTIEQALENVMSRNNGFGGGGDINLNLTVECEGYQLLNIMQKLDRQFYKQNGRHAFS